MENNYDQEFRSQYENATPDEKNQLIDNFINMHKSKGLGLIKKLSDDMLGNSDEKYIFDVGIEIFFNRLKDNKIPESYKPLKYFYGIITNLTRKKINEKFIIISFDDLEGEKKFSPKNNLEFTPEEKESLRTIAMRELLNEKDNRLCGFCEKVNCNYCKKYYKKLIDNFGSHNHFRKTDTTITRITNEETAQETNLTGTTIHTYNSHCHKALEKALFEHFKIEI